MNPRRKVKLVSVYEENERPTERTVNFLWCLLSERKPTESISHRQMPTFADHIRFVSSRPYKAWYLLQWNGGLVGAAYLTHEREIGVSIREVNRQCGFADGGVRALMNRHRKGGHFLANINPANEASIALFRKLGFGGPIQITLEKP